MLQIIMSPLEAKGNLRSRFLFLCKVSYVLNISLMMLRFGFLLAGLIL